jgi:hypothetical protein
MPPQEVRQLQKANQERERRSGRWTWLAQLLILYPMWKTDHHISTPRRGGALILAILFPILCGLIGFVAGAGGALLYNQFAKWLGGIELQMQGAPMLQPPA